MHQKFNDSMSNATIDVSRNPISNAHHMKNKMKSAQECFKMFIEGNRYPNGKIKGQRKYYLSPEWNALLYQSSNQLKERCVNESFNNVLQKLYTEDMQYVTFNK